MKSLLNNLNRLHRLLALGLGLAGTLPASALAQAEPTPRPRLAVIIVVDQLRPDYLNRFEDYFGEGGFKRLQREGAYFTQARYEHAVTETCPGHSIVATGAYANSSGIIANEWWNVAAGRLEYCARDVEAPLLGIEAEGRSPRNLLVSTVGDEMKLAASGRSKVVTVSGKDRSAIMLGGHLADAAYFMEDTLVVSSRYYMDHLPDWVAQFNAAGHVTGYFGKTWDRALPSSAYAALGPDDQVGERLKPGMDRSFPHVIDGGEDRPGAFFVEALEYSPFQNEIVIEFAREIVRREGLGQDDVPDLLGIGLSANDRIGHAFGPNSHEVADVTVRTDRLLADFLEFLDEEVGLDRTIILLTADHGVAPLPEVVTGQRNATDARRLDPATVLEAAESALVLANGTPTVGNWVAWQERPYVYLNEEAFAARGLALDEGAEVVATAIGQIDGINEVWTRAKLADLRAAGAETPVLRSFFPERSGHVMYVADPWVIEQPETDGTTHGSPWSYDQHVPVLWMGPGITPGFRAEAVSISDLAPTLSALLGVPRPSGAKGRVLFETR